MTASSSGDHFVLITGGPGSGKSTLIRKLRERGYSTAEEAGRAIIKEQSAIGGSALPWVDVTLFAETILSWDIRSYREAERNAGHLVFFDRGVPDAAGYFRLLGRATPHHFEVAVEAFRYRQRAFIAPPWPEIYTTDEERKQSFDEARRTFETLRTAYLEYGYELIELPLTSVESRVDFILGHQ
jgi:predicted ATPase